MQRSMAVANYILLHHAANTASVVRTHLIGCPMTNVYVLPRMHSKNSATRLNFVPLHQQLLAASNLGEQPQVYNNTSERDVMHTLYIPQSLC